MSNGGSNRKRSAKEAEIKSNGLSSKRRKENVKQKPKLFDVVFKNVRFEIKLTADMSIGETKDKIKRCSAMFLKNKEAVDVDNDHLRFSNWNLRAHSDDDRLGKFFVFDVEDSSNNKKEILIVEMAIAITLKVPNSIMRHGLFLFPSYGTETLLDLHFKAFDLASSQNPTYREHWFNIYRKGGDSSWTRLGVDGFIKDYLVSGDELEIKYDHPKAIASVNRNMMTVFLKTLTGKTIEMETFANGQGTVQDFRSMLQWRFKLTTNSSHSSKLIYAGRQLQDGKILNDYNIAHDDTVHFVLGLKGS